jgi:hypothetical protein
MERADKKTTPQPSEVMRYDRGTVTKEDAVFDEHSGFLRAPAVFTRVGVFEYLLEDGSVRREFRPPEEVFSRESLATLEMVPVTNEHPGVPVNSDNVKDYAVGSTSDVVYSQDEFVVGRIAVHQKEAIEDVKAGKRELSGGYRVQLDETPGKWNGISYDAVQRNIRYNHVALVPEGRAGPEVRLKLDHRHDSKSFGTFIKGEEKMEIEFHEDARKFRFNGASFDLSSKDGVKELKAAFDAFLKEKKDELKTKKDAADVTTDPAFVELQAKFDAAMEKLSNLEEKKEENKADAAFKARVAERVGLEKFAARFVEDSKVPSLSDRDLKVETILANTKEDSRDAKRETLSGKSDQYVDVLFDILKEDKAEEEKADAAIREQTPAQAPMGKSETKEDSSGSLVEDARKQYVNKLNGKAAN